MNTKYRVTVGAYGWAGEGRPSMPRDIGTASHGKNMWVVGIQFTAETISSTEILLICFTQSISLCAIRNVHAPVTPHSACCHGCIWHRAGVVMAARRERGKRTCPSLPGGLHQVSHNWMISCKKTISEALHLLNQPFECLLAQCCCQYTDTLLYICQLDAGHTRMNTINAAHIDTYQVRSSLKWLCHGGKGQALVKSLVPSLAVWGKEKGWIVFSASCSFSELISPAVFGQNWMKRTTQRAFSQSTASMYLL